MWFDNLQCSGQEGNIGACTNPGLGTLADNCGDHSQDAGVVCASKCNLNAMNFWFHICIMYIHVYKT